MRNPIMQRELVGTLRRRRALLLMVGLTAALALLVVLRWPDEGRASLRFGYDVYTGSPQEATELARLIRTDQQRLSAPPDTFRRPPQRQEQPPAVALVSEPQTSDESAAAPMLLGVQAVPQEGRVRLTLPAGAAAANALLDQPALRSLAARQGHGMAIREIREVPLGGVDSRVVLRVFAYGLMVSLLLLAPAFPATSIVRERLSGTLALLLNSPMRPWDIMLGKLVGVAGFVLVLVMLSLPAAAACYAMGGTGLRSELLPVYAVLILMALQYSTLGLLVSSYASSTDTALRVTYGLVLTMAVLTIGPYQFVQSVPDVHLTTLGVTLHLAGWPRTALDWLRSVSPIAAMMEALGQGSVGSGGLIGPGGVVGRYLILAAGSIIVLAAWTTRRLNRWMLDRPRAAGKVTDERSQTVRAYRRIMYLWFFDPQRRSGLIGPLTNPVLVKEFRCRRFGRRNWMMRLIVGCAVVSLALAWLTSLTWLSRLQQQENVAVLGSIIVILQMALIVLITPSLAAGLISSERESGGWQLLQLTPLPPRRIIVGKLLSVLTTLLLILVATLPGYAMMVVISPEQTPRVVRVLISLLLTALFTLLASAAISSMFKRTATATATAYTFIIALCAGTLLVWVAQGAPFSIATVQWVLRFNPLAAALQLIDAPGFRQYNLMPANLWIIGGGCVLALAVLLYRTRRLCQPS